MKLGKKSTKAIVWPICRFYIIFFEVKFMRLWLPQTKRNNLSAHITFAQLKKVVFLCGKLSIP